MEHLWTTRNSIWITWTTLRIIDLMYLKYALSKTFQKQKQFYFRFKNIFVSQIISKQKHFRLKNFVFVWKNLLLLFANQNIYASKTKTILLLFRKHFRFANVF